MVLRIDEWGVWPSSEDPYLFAALTARCFGEPLVLDIRRLKSMQFEPTEADAAITFLSQALRFGWGGIMFAGTEHWFRFSHDEFGAFYAEGRPLEHVEKLRRNGEGDGHSLVGAADLDVHAGTELHRG